MPSFALAAALSSRLSSRSTLNSTATVMGSRVPPPPSALNTVTGIWVSTPKVEGTREIGSTVAFGGRLLKIWKDPLTTGAPTPLGGTEVAAKLLNGVPKAGGQVILDKMDTRDPEIAADIRKQMLTFNDLESIDKRGFQGLLREIPTEDLVIALKTASDEMKEKVFSNVSSRAADQIKEESELLPPMRLSEIEQVQRQIVDVARRLEEEGIVTIDSGGGGDDVLV